MKANIELEWEQVDAIVISQLKSLMDCLQNDLEKVKEHRKGYVFTTDSWEEDAKEIKKHIKSFKRVLKYYGEDL